MEEVLKAYSLPFDYIVLASGRHRYPHISVIGAGAVGIEFATEKKKTLLPRKNCEFDSSIFLFRIFMKIKDNKTK